MMTDPVADMLTRIRNAVKSGADRVEIPASREKAGICKVLKDEGYIRSFKIIVPQVNRCNVFIKVLLKDKTITGLQRISRPGLRRYVSYKDVPSVVSGLGISVISTSRGILSSRDAKKLKVGGELICNVW